MQSPSGTRWCSTHWTGAMKNALPRSLSLLPDYSESNNVSESDEWTKVTLPSFTTVIYPEVFVKSQRYNIIWSCFACRWIAGVKYLHVAGTQSSDSDLGYVHIHRPMSVSVTTCREWARHLRSKSNDWVKYVILCFSFSYFIRINHTHSFLMDWRFLSTTGDGIGIMPHLCQNHSNIPVASTLEEYWFWYSMGDGLENRRALIGINGTAFILYYG